MFESVKDIVLGARYKDVVADCEGIVMSKTECLTGCDRVGLQSVGTEPKVWEVDVTHVDLIDKGVSERFAKAKEVAATRGGPPTPHRNLRS